MKKVTSFFVILACLTVLPVAHASTSTAVAKKLAKRNAFLNTKFPHSNSAPVYYLKK
jgi:hypothetical protein